MHPELPPVPGSSGSESSSFVAGGRGRRAGKMAVGALTASHAAGRLRKGPINLITLENGSDGAAGASASRPLLQRRRRQQQQDQETLLLDQDHLSVAAENGGKSRPRARGSIG